MKRVLCVWLPSFPIQRLHCEQPELKSAVCVLYTESGQRAQIVMLSREALRYGIRLGMSLAEAQALLESATFLPHDSAADARALQLLARRCSHYSPVVGLEQSSQAHGSPAECLVLDITGSAHLFGDEFGLAGQLVTSLAERGYFAHVAIANTIGAAWAIACYGHGTGSDRRLRSLPIEALRIPTKLASCLHEFDLRMIGQLRALPRDSLPSRFGSVLAERIDQMFGQREELLIPVPPLESVSARWETDEPICHPSAVRYVCEQLLIEILNGLQARAEGLLQLTVVLESEAQAPVTVQVGLMQPTDSVKHVMILLNLKLETQPIPGCLPAIRMQASVTAPLSIQQQQLFDHGKSDKGDVRRLMDRLGARLGRQAVTRPQLLPEAIPEEAVTYESLVASVPSSSSATELTSVGPTMASFRPLELFPTPQRIQAISIVPESSPAEFHWNRQRYQIRHCTKAERIATGWWRDAGSIQRDYYQVETKHGARFWLFRDKSGVWFLHGVFA